MLHEQVDKPAPYSAFRDSLFHLRGNIDDIPLAGGGNSQYRAEHGFTVHPSGRAGTKRLWDCCGPIVIQKSLTLLGETDAKHLAGEERISVLRLIEHASKNSGEFGRRPDGLLLLRVW